MRSELAGIVVDALLDRLPREQVVRRLQTEARTPTEFDAALRRFDTAGISIVTEGRR